MTATVGDDWLTTAEASRRLGVKRETLYSYVSRGMVESRRLPGSRESRFDSVEIGRLAKRIRSGGRAGALELIIDSGITLLEPAGNLYYRGTDVARLAQIATFEQVAEFLWTGELPQQVPSFRVPDATVTAVSGACQALGPAVRLVDRLRAALAIAAPADPLRFDRSPQAVIATSRRIIALEARAVSDGTVSAGRHDTEYRAVNPEAAAGRSDGAEDAAGSGASIAWHLWQALAGREGSEAEVAALDAALVLLADHGMASSTLAARLAATTWADPYLVISAGLAALGGPLAASLADQVAPMLIEAARRGAAPTLGERWRLGETVTGFEHVIYQDWDPRAEALWPYLQAAYSGHPAIQAAAEIVSLVTSSFPSVDFAVGALIAAAPLAEGSGEVIFSIARSAGWIAHAMEEYAHRLRFRSRSVYTGPAPPSMA